ncbi:hypothetical protein BFL43_07855 [Williamsia sp. 1135]|nr:hypothetical protein BFL43_07855 [Williamsia sp. 1135]
MAHYASEADFRKALLAKLNHIAATSQWKTQDVARAFALQQFTARIFRSESAPSWVLKGGTALQYRSTEARPTADADLALAAEAADIEGILRQALRPSPGEPGTFDVRLSTSRANPGLYEGKIVYSLAGQRFANASVDINTTRPINYSPEMLTPPPLVAIADLPDLPPLRLYPVHAHVADKLLAMYERHGAGEHTLSTRPHDLTDLVIIARSCTVDAGKLAIAVDGEQQRRGVELPVPLTLPNPQWATTYPAMTARSGLPPQFRDPHTALTAVNAFVEPVLSGRITAGTWDHTSEKWTTPTSTARSTPSVAQLLNTAAPTTRPRPTHRAEPPSGPHPSDNRIIKQHQNRGHGYGL